MKNSARVICVFLCASVSLPAALGGNLVQNPGFETTGSWSTSGSAGRVNGNVHTGSYAMRATSGNNGAWQQIAVTPYTTYTLTAWGKKDSTLTNLIIFLKDYGGTETWRYFTSTSYAQNSITFTPTVTSCMIGVWAWNGSGYGYADDFVLTSSSPTPTPTPTPSPALVQNIWIAVRTDGLAGLGTQADPFNGSTPEKFDALMFRYYWTYNLGVHLMGPGPFRTYTTHRWLVRPGWVLSGDGMYSTTIQMVGSLAGIHYGLNCISSDPNISTNYATIRDLTVDCNWAQLSTTADTGAGGEKNIATNAIQMWGSNNLIERVRCINTYGSWANLKEQVAISLAGPKTGDGTGNVIQFCRVELPQGNYGAPFGLGGWNSSTPSYLITNSKVVSCSAFGVNDGLTNGFTSGGVNLGNVKNCQVNSNTFTDCYGAAYIDTGSVDGLQVTNNTVIRGWSGVGLGSHALPKQNIQITGNNFSIQNRAVGGGTYGIGVGYGVTTNLTISNNTITFDNSGGGLPQFWGISASLLSTATISNNTIDNKIGTTTYPVYNTLSGSALTMFNNRAPDGTLIPALNNP
jgi:hypothetical protein